ncbi:deoxyribonuclease V [Halomonas piscis]|uniref:Endonuclease V n=1 Tax=Halomonas piscis TaxID=3031727 RepID=A0ABY9YX43_9GAMM|nr:deoxyribonuclease V [Halomonas piscis]WNK19455.1 deoxyribonuclease V [Halomonas piscis]
MPVLPPETLHEWNLSPAEAVALQSRLASRVVLEDRFAPVRRVAGVDIGFEDDGATTRAAIVVLDWQAGGPPFEVVEQVVYREPTRMPYIPGLLSFRETPAALGAFARLETRPELVMVDGQGIAHPRRLGVASLLGLWLDLPAIGVAKSRLCGRHDEVGDTRGEQTPLVHKGEVIGTVLRSRTRVKPLYVSPGHRVSQAAALEWTLRFLHRTKLPEPTRLADRLASRRDASGRR